MATLLKIFSTPLMVVALALIVNAEYNVARFNIYQGKDYSKDSFNKSEYRLPKSIVPDAYNLKITNIDFDKFIFNGTTTITARVKDSVKEIILNAGSISVFINSILENGENINVVETKYNKTTEILKIILAKKLFIGSTLKISLSFGGKLRDDMIGFYKSSYYDEKGKQRWLAGTQFEHTSARHAFPCFDEPEFKAEFEIEIRVPKGYSCLSNMKFTMDEANQRYRFEKSVKMSTYLVAFVISDFQPDPNNDSLVKLWARPSARNQTVYGQTIGVKALKALSELLGQNYYDSMDKMDMVALPDFAAGAMENWGLITYHEAYGLYDENHSSLKDKQTVVTTITHECAHMWFGNLVTFKWWRYLWLSEAFASYFMYEATDLFMDDWHMDEQVIVDHFQGAMAVDSIEDSKPMTRKSEDAITQNQVTAISDTITYSKGGSILRMMEKTFGKDKFLNGLRNYLETRKYNSATPDHVWQAVQQFVDSKLDIATIMKTWTEQAGYPYITVKVEPNSIKLKQTRFLLHPNNNVSAHSPWWVPITVSSSSSPSESTKPVFWLSEQEGEIERDNIKDDWIILNVKSAGFYRVNYDEDSWERIIKHLSKGDFSKIHVINRAAIVDDLLNLARAKLVDYKLVFRGLQYLEQEKHYLPFKTALAGLDYLTRVTVDNFGYKLLKGYIMALVENIYDELTFDDKPEDDILTIYLRQELNSKVCGFDDASCVKKSQTYFSEWRARNKKVPANQRSVVYCTALKRGVADDWEFLYKQFRKTNLASEIIIILKALGCSQDAVVLEKYLKDALSGYESSRIRDQDMRYVFSGIYTASIKNAEFIIDFANNNHEAFYKHDKNYDTIGSIITGALKTYPVKRLINKVEKILESNATHIAPNVASIKKSLDFVKKEIDLFSGHLLPVIDSIN